MPFHILVVDDDPGVRDMLTLFLRRRGYLVASARDGEEALASVRANDPDLILLDIYMPKMSGLEVLYEIRDEDLSTRIIALSGIPDEHLISSLEELGAHAFMPKPLDFPALTAQIDANLMETLGV